MDTFLDKFPPSVESAVEKLLNDMSFAEKTRLANMNEAALIKFHQSYGRFIRTEFRLPGNDPLMQSCMDVGYMKKITAEQASFVIVKAMHAKLQQVNVLKIVK